MLTVKILTGCVGLVAVLLIGLWLLYGPYGVPKIEETSLPLSSDNHFYTRHKSISSDNAGKRPRLPKALIIGFSKCGTLALRTFLTIHPDIVCPIYEINYFNENYHKGIEWYRNQMPSSTAKQITIEKTPGYLRSLEYLRRIRAFDSEIKLLVIVRDPIVRLQSQYAHELSKLPDGFERPGFESWCNEEHGNGDRILHFTNYAYKLGLVYSVFSKPQVLVLSEEDMEKNPLPVMREVETFLGLRRGFTDDMFVYSPKRGFYCLNVKHQLFPSIAQKVKANRQNGCLYYKTKGREHPVIDKSFRRTLQTLIRPYNELFFNLTGKRFKWENF
ncbi:hypothetical protein RRG08_033520 [Elysia crispata]|uniref:Sulfotransferase domain-containing protein n=1 Tax=Elysia crispata TaxID=231223 RepID=A0AAE0XNX1_9GAST|nr:hypothetical protein RRG08_033520 [Elysia crispata]